MAGLKFPYKAAFVACAGDGTGKCPQGCTGCGACVNACRLGAVTLVPGSAAKIDETRCRACGLCEKACPRHIIHIRETADRFAVACAHTGDAREAKSACPAACLGCGLCEKNCTASAIRVTAGLARMDERLCLHCGRCLTLCPRRVIHDTKGILVR